MKKLFISQPMKGKSENEIMKERESAIRRAELVIGEEVEVIDSYFTEDEPQGVNSGLWWLGKSLLLLATADIVYFAQGWDKARGCKIEHACAEEYGIRIID